MRVKKDMKRVKRCENRMKTVSRCLKYNGQKITWDQFKSAFHYDQESFSLPQNKNLTLEPFNLDPTSKMWIKLAEDVLDSKMLFLIQEQNHS